MDDVCVGCACREQAKSLTTLVDYHSATFKALNDFYFPAVLNVLRLSV
jgi:hypothetical protein